MTLARGWIRSWCRWCGRAVSKRVGWSARRVPHVCAHGQPCAAGKLRRGDLDPLEVRPTCPACATTVDLIREPSGRVPIWVAAGPVERKEEG